MFANQQQQNRPPGIPCPKCSFFIEMSLQSLLYNRGFKCPVCHLELTMDRASSQPALELIQKLNVAMENVERAKKFER